MPRQRPNGAVTRRTTVTIVVAALLVVATIVYLVSSKPNQEDSNHRPLVRTATTEITRGDLLVYEEIGGKLGYVESEPVVSRVAGTVTWMANAGATLQRGERIATVNDIPVFLMYGAIPAYRALAEGVTGPDVRQLEENLHAMGYRGFDVNENFKKGTARAVKRWQDKHDLPETGVVSLGLIHFSAGPAMVGKVEIRAGAVAKPDDTIAQLSGTQQLARVDVPVAKLPAIRSSRRVSVSMPGGARVPGTIVKVSTVVDEPAEGEDGGPTVAVDVKLDEQASTEIAETPVDVRFERERRENVLTVPVNALLASPTGAYSVVVAGKSRKRIAVKTGMFSDGRVEISGSGIREGMKVEVPAT